MDAGQLSSEKVENMQATRLYHYLNTELSDPRTRDWFLIDSPLIVTLISCAYLYVVLKLGPAYMKNRPAYSLSTFIRFYNIFEIVANALVIYHMLDAGWHRMNPWYCISADYSRTPRNDKLIAILWHLTLLKFIDYVETVVFVLRKKQRQISFLHLYHHVSTVLVSWFIVKYHPHAMIIMIVMVNCGVHVVMYSYYLIASFGGPLAQKVTSMIKPFITIMQIGQFVFLIAHQMQAFFSDCTGVQVISGTMSLDLLINLILFVDFYQKNYLKKSKQS